MTNDDEGGGGGQHTPIQLPRVIEGGVDINDSREFELHPRAALATMGGWAAPQGKVVCSPLCPGVQPPPQY